MYTLTSLSTQCSMGTRVDCCIRWQRQNPAEEGKRFAAQGGKNRSSISVRVRHMRMLSPLISPYYALQQQPNSPLCAKRGGVRAALKMSGPPERRGSSPGYPDAEIDASLRRSSLPSR